MTKKKIDPRTASKKAEQDLMAVRLEKVNKLAAAKETHDKAVKKAQEEELLEYSKQLDQFMKRAPDLVHMATQVSKLTTLPTVKIGKFWLDKEEYTFGAFRYTTNPYKSELETKCIGAFRPAQGFGSPQYMVIGPDGQWIARGYTPDTPSPDFRHPIETIDEKRGYPNAKDFMLAALEWEKQLYALVDSL